MKSKAYLGVSLLAVLACAFPGANGALAAGKTLGTIPAANVAGAPTDVPTLLVTNKPMSQVLPVDSADAAATNADAAAANADTAAALAGADAAVANTDAGIADLSRGPRLKPHVAGLVSTSGDGVYKDMMTEAPSINADTVLGKEYFSPADTTAAKKINELREEMFKLQSRVSDLSDRLGGIQQVGQELAANYYASVATINTQLQSGTTPGNPRLVERLSAAQDALETLSGNVADLNALALQISDAAAMSGYLQESARAAYGLTGSVEEDYARLAQLEDSISNTSVLIERLLNNVNDDITRSAAYLSSERSNLRTLSLAIANGDLYGRSLANRPFLSVAQSTVAADMAAANRGLAAQPASLGMAQPASLGGPTPQAQAALSSPRPLVVIRFDRPDVDFQQAVYQSVSEALERYPNARFELVAVAPGAGNPARKAIESTRSRRNAEKVLRTLTQMGLPAERIDLSAMTNDNAQTNEVQLYIR
ncbi:MAG: hypothetical protein KDJ49_06870 [Alphaproteobacteria bacterium]|nr:hypothetical protein [Alphaproteobacteria bacterium]USO07441.1 MAG: hypothetical protein H6866_08510 [Rhodospirillales bacterium]